MPGGSILKSFQEAVPETENSVLRGMRSTCGPDPSADHILFAYAKDLEGNDSYRISCHLRFWKF